MKYAGNKIMIEMLISSQMIEINYPKADVNGAASELLHITMSNEDVSELKDLIKNIEGMSGEEFFSSIWFV